MVRKARNEGLTIDDVWTPPPETETREAFSAFEAAWKHEVENTPPGQEVTTKPNTKTKN